MNLVNEGTMAWLTATFKDKAGVPSAPASVQYRVDCQTTGTAIRALTTLASPASSMEITLDATDTRVVDPTNMQEYRRVTVIATYGAGDKLVGEYDFIVHNLDFVN